MEGKELKLIKILIFILFTIILCIVINKVYYLIVKNAYPITYKEYVEKYSKEYGIDKNWIYAIIKAESNFEKESISSSGAVRTDASYV